MHLGLDLGTSELKALLIDAGHHVCGLARVPLQVRRPRPRWSEQDPADWWLAAQFAIDALQARHATALAATSSIGLSGQMHGAVLLDAAHRVLRPAMLWNDGRSSAQCDTLVRSEPSFTTLTGNLAMPGFTAPKLQWVREHEPEVFAQTALVLLPKDLLRLRLTGDAATDMSDASGTLWLDVGKRRWSSTLLAACGLDEAQMPRLLEGSAPSGTLHATLAARWGMKDGVVVAGGGGDNAASAVGLGCIDDGQGFVSLGTSGVIFASGARFEPNPAQALHAFCHALPARWHRMSVMLSASSALTWATRAWGWADETALLEDASRCSPLQRNRAPMFLPYLSGERSPLNRADLQASLHGLTHEHERSDVAYAVLEGVCLGLRDGWQTFDADTRPRSLDAVGGGTRSRSWLQQLSDTLSVPLAVHSESDLAGATGAARLGWLAVGGARDDVCRRPALQTEVEPDPTQAAAIGERFDAFKRLQRHVLDRT